MLTRRHLRVKVMQQLYANTMSQPFDLKLAQKQLQSSNEGFFELYLFLLNMFIEVQSCGHSLHKLVKKQYLEANSNQLNPKFFSNLAIAKISGSETLKKYTNQLKITHWQNHDEYVRLIWDQIAASDAYAAYLAEGQSGFSSDKNDSTASIPSKLFYIMAAGTVVYAEADKKSICVLFKSIL